MLDDLTIIEVENNLENAVQVLRGNEITPEHFTRLSLALDSISSVLVACVAKEPSSEDIESMVLLAEREFFDAVGNQQNLVHDMAKDEVIEPLSELFQMGVLPDVDMNDKFTIGDIDTVTESLGSFNPLQGVSKRPMTIDEQIKAKLNQH